MKMPKPLDRNDYKPLYAQLGDNLIEYIESNGLKPGDPIPSENELIKYYGVSSLTVRLAMQRLSTEGIINRIQGKGTFVAERRIKAPVEGIVSLKKRLENEGFNIKIVFVEATETHPTRYHLEALRLSEGSKCLKVRRVLRAAYGVLGVETMILPLGIARRFDQEEFKSEPFEELLNRNPETRVFRVLYRIRSSPVLDLEAEIMNVPVDSLALVQYGIFYNKHDKPLMSGRVTYLSEKLELECEVRLEQKSLQESIDIRS